MFKTVWSLGFAGGWRTAQSWLTCRSTISWMMLGAGFCVSQSSVQQMKILDSMSVRYETLIHKFNNASKKKCVVALEVHQASTVVDYIKSFVLFSFRMRWAASSARPGFVPHMHRQLTSRTSNHKTCLPKVGQPGLRKVNILHTGCKATAALWCVLSTHSPIQRCLRRDETHAIVLFHPSSLHFRSHHMTSSHNKLQQFTSISTFNQYHPSIVFRWSHVESLITFSFFLISQTLTLQVIQNAIPCVTRSLGIMAINIPVCTLTKYYL